ncbi:MAG: hypothetical protein KH704_11110 [Clostridiales bacterium]|nr:hypothetical protein [Clostridiales bacterium]
MQLLESFGQIKPVKCPPSFLFATPVSRPFAPTPHFLLFLFLYFHFHSLFYKNAIICSASSSFPLLGIRMLFGYTAPFILHNFSLIAIKISGM